MREPTRFSLFDADIKKETPNFKFKLATKKKFSRRLVVQAFFRIVINPIFDECDFFGSRFLSFLKYGATFGVEPISLYLIFSLIIAGLSYVWIDFEINKLNELILKK